MGRHAGSARRIAGPDQAGSRHQLFATIRGALAAGRLKTSWDCVVTAEEAGYQNRSPVLIVSHSPGSACRQPRPRSSPGPATTCSAPAPWACARIGTTASGLSVPIARRHPQFKSPTLDQLIPWLEGHR